MLLSYSLYNVERGALIGVNVSKLSCFKELCSYSGGVKDSLRTW